MYGYCGEKLQFSHLQELKGLGQKLSTVLSILKHAETTVYEVFTMSSSFIHSGCSARIYLISQIS